jgi:transcription antitermination factor NusG
MFRPVHLHATTLDAIPSTEALPSAGGPWYAIRVRSKFESAVSASLQGKGYDTFLPVYRLQRRWSDRVKELDLPLFPGYLFCRFNPHERLLPILTTPGVLDIVGYGKTPVPVDDQEIGAVKSILRSGLGAEPWPFLRVGSEVYIEAGPLAGVEGIITNTDKVYRLIVSVNLLQRSVAVEIDRDWVRHVAGGPRSTAASEGMRSLARGC